MGTAIIERLRKPSAWMVIHKHFFIEFEDGIFKIHYTLQARVDGHIQYKGKPIRDRHTVGLR